ncbi:putative iron (III) dicitrate transport substrate binding protein [Thermoclostridium stercorarium subsp. stercorarium DSM 8532]|jgi:iron complex transport system substrate-binding protein|uniref:Oxidoreductase n=3 Tax=Thermoclostridium stercorarium TaxID=1510 RepID=A0A1B1YMX1_THEST|nr:ABC transporter substrate-binding protein [Thermoclostridium stercorarium]AGC69190.1 putative iron (III) dicitrate transport substrate binding protein [Thermoclostridium stercorarium subsp. stercorarium DSM 8532]AGI40160.1 ABC transporter periplasmic subunit [Thermoclostridium stercorarium subsp. stercorarium DSM 8532]ANW99467.1 oxidoreductase [Thermoclostridium stercorarium subsp. thermolacticum DSM 2910]ANX02093.1 oxidoreductase [Thermoclostridium stercorarium subsp. leptospartum DSM 9219]
MKKGLILLSFLLTIFLTAGCGKTNNSGSLNTAMPTPVEMAGESLQQTPETENNTVYPLEITDSKGNTVKFGEEPKKVVSLSPNITEIIYALGKGDRLVGRTALCDYPEDVSNVTVVGDFYEWNFETILSLEPDVVFASSLNTEENEKKLKELGVNVVFLTQVQSFESTYEIIELIGKILNAGEEAEKVINKMKETVSAVQKAAEGKERPSVYYVVGYGEYGDYTATGETFISDMIEMAGGDNIAADTTGWVYSLEKLIEKDPDIIIGAEDAKEYFEKTSGYKDLTAVREGRVYAIDVNLLERQGPRLAEGLVKLYEIFHSESLPDSPAN